MANMLDIQLHEKSSPIPEWNSYIESHPYGTAYHNTAFLNAIQDVYKNKTVYITALHENRVVGVLPLVQMKGLLGSSELVSISYCDYGGILAQDTHVAREIANFALKTIANHNSSFVELRQTDELNLDKDLSNSKLVCNTSKIRMRLDLPKSISELNASFTPKLRAQIKRPIKEGCFCKIGREELIDDFYKVFSYNMRDLGSPVHPKALIRQVLHHFKESAKLYVVYLKDQPLACACILKHNNEFINPWASSDKRFRKIAPNMLLYWSMLEDAINNGCTVFDFGRSTPGEGTFKFKEQWGAKPQQLFWYYLGNSVPDPDTFTKKDFKKELFIKLWSTLPVKVTQIVGPFIRRRISL